tara:strand:+ start:7319 stop:7912 length:594 start_codon:yes stop_codon:yes gene_type:complete
MSSIARQKEYDAAYLDMCYRWADLSYAKRLKVGCFIIKNDNIISQGRNGTPPGEDNCCEYDKQVFKVKDGVQTSETILCTKANVIHAERNALARLTRSTESCEGATMYITHAPCYDCSLLIRSCGIARVVFSEIWHSDSGQRAGCNISPEQTLNELEEFGIRTLCSPVKNHFIKPYDSRRVTAEGHSLVFGAHRDCP